MKLKQYQQEGIAFLTNNKTALSKHSILGDDMGLGKTVQTIKAAETLGAKKILVICPSAVKINWMREVLQWSSYKNIFIAGKQGSKAAKDCVIDKNAEWVIINYDMCIMPKIKKQLKDMKFSIGILDECHYLMNRTSGRTKAILAKGGIIWNCDYKWALSGTFMKNRNRDVFPILRALTPHVLGDYLDYKRFAERYCGGHMGAFGFDDSRSTNTEELGKRIEPIMLRRTKDEVLSELPSIIEQNIYLEKTSEIERVVSSENELSEEEKEAILNFELLGQTASYRKQLAMAKLPQTIQIVKELMTQIDKLVIFAYHRDFISELTSALAAYGVECVMGGLTGEQKQERVDNFINDPNIKIFIGQINAAGTGIDGLQLVCSNVLFAELDWVPGALDQAKARCHRMGQNKTVHTQYLIVPDSLEESMLNVLKYKRHNIKSVMKQIEKALPKTQKGEQKMTLEMQLGRIADALEKLVDSKTETSQCCDEVVIKPKKSKAKKTETAPVIEENTVEEVVEQSMAEAPVLVEPIQIEEEVVDMGMVYPTAPSAPEVVQAVAEAKPAKTSKEELTNAIKIKAGELITKIGQEPATLFINEITAQITATPGARLASCNVDQLDAVKDAVQAKIDELNSLGGI